MTTNRYVVATALALLALVATAACSTSSKSSAPPSTVATPPTTVAPNTRAGGTLGACPAKYPTTLLSVANSGVPGLDQTLVPFAATNVRACRYGAQTQLIGEGVLPATAVTAFETTANAMTKAPGGVTCAKEVITHLFLVSFTSATQRVDLGESDACGGGVSNGALFAHESPQFTAGVVRYAVSAATAKAG